MCDMLFVDMSKYDNGAQRMLSKAQFAGIQSPDPHAQTGLRIITLSLTLTPTLTLALALTP